MTIEEINTALSRVGIPVRYDHGEEGLEVPFIYFTFVRGSLLDADNIVYATKHELTINLVTTTKAEQLTYSEKIEEVLTELEIPYGMPDEGWSSGEKIYLLTYNTEV